MISLLQRAEQHGERCALIDEHGSYSYTRLLGAARRIAGTLLQGRKDLSEARVAFMVPPGFDYVAVQWGIWLAGGIAVPLCLVHPLPELGYVLENSSAEAVVVHPQYQALLQPLQELSQLSFFSMEDLRQESSQLLPQVDAGRGGMILYTSGTTSKPKGVVLTHNNIISQITTLIEAWHWSATDHILHVLPLHHTHGIINVLCCALWSGAVCEMMPKFDAAEVWRRFLTRPLTLFMAVPTIYVRLIDYWEHAAPEEKTLLSRACRTMRLMVSGSAALPVSVLEKWRQISSHTLLERYGMTEIGMALSNPYQGERRAGYVGQPLPGVALRLVDEHGAEIRGDGVSGEIQIKGGNVFTEYWQKPEPTREAFRDGWFLTGDMCERNDGYYRIIGRSSVDIIKSGGYKISALQIEEVLRSHPAISECAVVGVPDAEWGEVVSVAAVLRPGAELALAALRVWAKERLAVYKVPARLCIVEDLPRNVMGKVTKPEVKKLFEEDADE